MTARRFYKLFDVMSAGRWHLGGVYESDGTELEFMSGVAYSGRGELVAEVSQPGRVLEFSLTSFAVPVVTRALGSAIAQAAGADVQCFPVTIGGQSGMVVLNSGRLVSCLDEERSEFLKWTARDHRADLAGKYRQVTRLVIDPGRIPGDAHFFRVSGWPVALIVSERVKSAMERVGCKGATFTDVTPGD